MAGAYILSYMRIYYIKVSGIASGNKLIKRYDILTCEDMISSHVKISMTSVISNLSLKLSRISYRFINLLPRAIPLAFI